MSTIKEQILDVVEELRYGHPETRKSAAIKLGRIRHQDVIPYLVEAIEKDEYVWTRVSAIQSLGWIADKSVVPSLIRCVENDENDLVRKTAITTIGAMRDTRAIDILVNIVRNTEESDDLRNAASLAVEIINGITPDYSQQV